jgi:hypothetical protein
MEVFDIETGYYWKFCGMYFGSLGPTFASIWQTQSRPGLCHISAPVDPESTIAVILVST